MNIEELQALAKAVEPLTGVTGNSRDYRQFEVYNHLVSRFRERVTVALDGLAQGQGIEGEITQELWLMAKALPGVRRRAEEAAQRSRLDPIE